jgi:hypothetical protein
MHARSQGLMFLTAFVVLGSGCVSTATSGDDARNARLPVGVTLLDTDRNQCQGTVAIDGRSIRSARSSDLVIQPGQNATFTVQADADDDVEVEWRCIGAAAAAAERETTDCPDQTSHVRITRELTGNEFLLECYGERVSSNRR